MESASPNLQAYPVTVDEWHEHHKTLMDCDDALFGAWDSKTRKRVPGMVERIEFITMVLKIMVPLIAISALKDIGVPTQVILPAILKILGTSLGG